MKLQRVFTKYFLNEQQQNHYERYGYVSFPLLDDAALERLRTLMLSARSTITDDVTQSVYASGCSPDYSLRNRIGQIIDSEIPRLLTGVVDTEVVELMGGTMLLKAPGDSSFLQPHLDNAVLDESRYSSVFLWIPLVDVNEENGCLYVLPETHLLDHGTRGMMSPYPYKQWDELVYEYGVPVPLKAGHALAMDHALLHYSLNNKSRQERIAFTFNLKPKAAQQIHSWYEADKNLIEHFKVDVRFYFNENFFERPKHLELISAEPYRAPQYTREEFEEFLKQAAHKVAADV